MTNMELLIKNAENELQALQKTVGHEAVNLNELLLELKKQHQQPHLDVQELWDEYSEFVDDDLDSLSRFAGGNVVTERSFKKLISELNV